MQRTNINGLNLWQFNNLTKETGIIHFVTDRIGNDKLKDFTLSYSSSPHKEEIKFNRNQLSSALGVQNGNLFIPSQVHQSRIVKVTSDTTPEELRDTDALITNEKGICIAVLAADCVPVLLFDQKNKAIGAIHSGWRGTVTKILEKALLLMHETFGTRGEDLIAAIGPSVCQDSYEVGEEVAEQFYQAFGSQAGLVAPQPFNKAKVDLWKANQLQLNSFGVPEASIEFSNLCTLKQNQHFFSARKGDLGRFATGIMMV